MQENVFFPTAMFLQHNVISCPVGFILWGREIMYKIVFIWISCGIIRNFAIQNVYISEHCTNVELLLLHRSSRFKAPLSKVS